MYTTGTAQEPADVPGCPPTLPHPPDALWGWIFHDKALPVFPFSLLHIGPGNLVDRTGFSSFCSHCRACMLYTLSDPDTTPKRPHKGCIKRLAIRPVKFAIPHCAPLGVLCPVLPAKIHPGISAAGQKNDSLMPRAQSRWRCAISAKTEYSCSEAFLYCPYNPGRFTSAPGRCGTRPTSCYCA